MDTVMGIGWVMLGAVFLGTFALPSKYIKNYQWENTWGAFFLFAMLIVPVGFAMLVVKDLWGSYEGFSGQVIFGVVGLSALWGIGFCCWGYGLSKVGLSLGYSLTMGTMALVGSIVPFFLGNADMAATVPGMVVIGGILICIAGVAVNGFAGVQREKSHAADRPPAESEGQAEAKKGASFAVGLLICVLAGVLSSGLNIAFHVGSNADVEKFTVASDLKSDLKEGPLSRRLIQQFKTNGITLSDKAEATRKNEKDPWQITDKGTGQTYSAKLTAETATIYVHGIGAASGNLGNPPYLAGLSTWTLVFLGGMISSVAYCVFLLCKNKTWKGFKNPGSSRNLVFAFVMAVGHFACIFFYGIGGWKLGALGTSVGFAIFQSGSLLIGNGLGFFTGEWKGASAKSKQWLLIGLSVLILGIVVVSVGNSMAP